MEYALEIALALLTGISEWRRQRERRRREAAEAAKAAAETALQEARAARFDAGLADEPGHGSRIGREARAAWDEDQKRRR